METMTAVFARTPDGVWITERYADGEPGASLIPYLHCPDADTMSDDDFDKWEAGMVFMVAMGGEKFEAMVDATGDADQQPAKSRPISGLVIRPKDDGNGKIIADITEVPEVSGT